MFREFLRRGGWLIILPAFVIIAALNAAMHARSASARLAAEGVEAEATITEKREQRRLVPGVRSKLVEPDHLLRFSYSSGSVLRGNFHVGTGEGRVSQAFYDRAAVGSTVPLRYLADDDSVLELEPGSLAGEADNALAIAALIAVLSLPVFVIVWRNAARARREAGTSAQE